MERKEVRQVEDAYLKRGVYTMGAHGPNGETILWAVRGDGRRLREAMVETEELVPAEVEHLWMLLEQLDPLQRVRPRLRLLG